MMMSVSAFELKNFNTKSLLGKRSSFLPLLGLQNIIPLLKIISHLPSHFIVGILKAYCKEVGLEYRDSMIHWGPISNELKEVCQPWNYLFMWCKKVLLVTPSSCNIPMMLVVNIYLRERDVTITNLWFPMSERFMAMTRLSND